MEIFLICLVVFLLILTIYAFSNRSKINKSIEEKNQQLEIKYNNLLKENNNLGLKNIDLKTRNIGLEQHNNYLIKQQKELTETAEQLKSNTLSLKSNIDILNTQAEKLKRDADVARAQATAAHQELNSLNISIKEASKAQQSLASSAFESYCETLENAYAEADKQYDTKIVSLANAIDYEKQQLEEIKTTRAAAQQALLKEQEVKENKDNYRLIPSQSDLEDIRELERVKRNLHKPRILSMLIWQTYWQPLSKVKFPTILQDKTKCGIYKITNTETNEAYIGQSVDIYKRWSDHCKCGLGIDTPPGNKLYKAMQDYGLNSFTFELLAECPKEELDAKERYFIELYQAKEFGYNGRTQ